MIYVGRIIPKAVAVCDMPNCSNRISLTFKVWTKHGEKVKALGTLMSDMGWAMDAGYHVYCPEHVVIDHFSTEDAIHDMQVARTNTDTTLSNTNMINMISMM